MISVKELLYELDLKLNNLTNLEHQEVPVENKIVVLNKAQIKLIKTKLNPNNPLQLGFEGNRKRYQDLENLVESAHDHKLTITKVDKHLGKWEIDVSGLTPKFMFFLSGYALAKKGTCSSPIYINEYLTKHADLTTVLANSHTKPSFEYQETPCTLSNNKVEVYDDGTFEYEQAYISYIRYPQKIDFEGYINLDGEPSITQDCELADYLKEELLNYAIMDLRSSFPDIQGMQISDKEINSQE